MIVIYVMDKKYLLNGVKPKQYDDHKQPSKDLQKECSKNLFINADSMLCFWLEVEEMKPNQVKSVLKDMYFNQTERFSVLLLGPPGIGKSTCVRETAMEISQQMGREFIEVKNGIEEIIREPDRYFLFLEFQMNEVEPTDLLGIPSKTQHGYVYEPFQWSVAFSKCPGILFLDDFTDIKRLEVFSAAYRIIQDRKVGMIKFHPQVMVIAAGNKPEYSALSEFLPIPLWDRFIKIFVDPPAVDEWGLWMNHRYGSKWDQRVYAFLKRFETEGMFLRIPEDQTKLDLVSTPRGWSKVALLGDKNWELLEGCVSPEFIEKFKAFTKCNINLEKLMENPSKWKELSLDSKYMVCSMLSTWIRENKTIKPAVNLIREISSDSSEWLVVILVPLETEHRAKLVDFLDEKTVRGLEFIREVKKAWVYQ